MKKTTFDQRFEKAVNAFFEDDKSFENSQLAVTENHSILTTEKDKLTTEKIDSFINILKQVFLFFPGTQILYFLGAFVAFTQIVDRLNFPSIFNLWILFWLLSGTFMTWAGLGDLKNSKHWILPASTLATGTILGTFFGILAKAFPEIHKLIFGDLPIFLLLFPLAFIVPILVKGWLDKEEIDEQN